MTSSEPSTYRHGSIEANSEKSVLVVDDNVLNRRLFGAMLSAEGYRVLEASDGPSGLRAALENLPDLIVLDVHLPVLSGLEVRRQLREEADTQHIPILIATGDPVASIEEEIRASELDGYMAKPIAVSEFVSLVDWLLLRAQIAIEMTP
jgi:two-component system, cell cycle response regulator DivK